jgi:hypothetical protein
MRFSSRAALWKGFSAFYSIAKVRAAQFTGGRALSRIRKRSVEAFAVIQFSSFQNLAAVKAFDILSVVVPGDYTCALMLAGRVRHFYLN